MLRDRLRARGFAVLPMSVPFVRIALGSLSCRGVRGRGSGVFRLGARRLPRCVRRACRLLTPFAVPTGRAVPLFALGC